MQCKRSNLPHLWLLHQTASQLLWGWWPKCPHLQGLTTPDHRMLLCEGFPGSSQWFEFDLMSLCLGRDLHGHTGSVHPAAEKTPQDRGASTSDKSIRFESKQHGTSGFPPSEIYTNIQLQVFFSVSGFKMQRNCPFVQFFLKIRKWKHSTTQYCSYCILTAATVNISNTLVQ